MVKCGGLGVDGSARLECMRPSVQSSASPHPTPKFHCNTEKNTSSLLRVADLETESLYVALAVLELYVGKGWTPECWDKDEPLLMAAGRLFFFLTCT